MLQAGSKALFEAVIVPHRSLTRRGFYWLILVVSALSALITFFCLRLGAWPVVGFNAAEVALAFLLLNWHSKTAKRESEVLLLSESGLSIRRSNRGRREEKMLPVQWLKVVLEERRGRVPALILAAHGVHEEIARSLGEEEKRDLAAALAAAFDRMRHPKFDNPQLAEVPR